MSFRSTARLLGVTTATIATLCLGVTGCKPEQLQSTWLKPSATIEGNPDWWNLPTYRIEKLDGTVTIVNDSTGLYLRLFSRDRRLTRRLRMAGLAVWLNNPSGRKTERLGIHYPVGMHGKRASFQPDHYLPNANLAPEVVGEMLSQQNENLEILSSDSSLSGNKTPDDAQQIGVRAHLGETTGGATEYALRIGMGQLAPWIKPGSLVQLEIQSPAMNREAFHGEGEGSEGEGHRGEGGGRSFPGGGGGFGGGGGGFDGHHGGQGGRHGRESRGDSTGASEGIPPTSPIHFVFNIQLAATAVTNSVSGK
jgi:hypothetical protein